MPRLLTLSLLLVAATPGFASADECLISSPGLAPSGGGMSGISIADPLVETFGNESVDVALEIDLGLRQPPPRGDELGMGDEGMLWCLSPDDPRCFPVDAPAGAPSFGDPMPSSVGPETPRVPPLTIPRAFERADVFPGPAGEKSRVERPPQG
jgi:hypothetical protein